MAPVRPPRTAECRRRRRLVGSGSVLGYLLLFALVRSLIAYVSIEHLPFPSGKMAAKPFNYDISTLIELIKNRPCIWDKNLDAFRDRTEKQRAWDEICATLEPDFFRKDKKEQRRIGELIAGKWQNVRDAFVKSLRKQSTHPSVRRYLYHQKLQFLMKVLHRDDDESKLYLQNSLDDGQTERTEDADTTKSDEASLQKKPRLQDGLDQDILMALRNTKTAPDEDEAFFISITPTVRRMSEEDKLEFRMGVLQLIKDINSRGRDLPDAAFFSSPGNSSSNSHPSTSFTHYSNPKLNSENFIEETHLFKCE